MPTVRRFSRSRIAMYFGDHPPPHFHVISGAEEIQVEIETLAVIKGEADPRDTAEALEWAASNREELRARWREYSEESKP
jgi:nicotinamide mononucleotide adenylyltransferase